MRGLQWFGWLVVLVVLMVLVVFQSLVSYSTINGTQSSDFNIYCVLKDALRTVAFGAQKWATVAASLLPVAWCRVSSACQFPINLSQLGRQWLFMCKLYNECCTYAGYCNWATGHFWPKCLSTVPVDQIASMFLFFGHDIYLFRWQHLNRKCKKKYK